MDAAGRWMALTIGGDAVDETRLDTVAALQATGAAALLVALAWRDGADLLLSPFATLPGPDDAVLSFDLPAPRRDAPAAVGLLDRVRRGLVELGGRMEDRARLDRLDRLAERLDAAELRPLARLLAALDGCEGRERPLHLLPFVHAAACHVALSLRPPIVQCRRE